MPKKYSKKQKVTKRQRRYSLWIPIIIVALVVLGLAGYGIHHHYEKKKITLTSTTSETKPTINYKPAPPADNNNNQSRKLSSTPSPTLGSSTSQTAPGSYTVQIVSTNVSSSNVHVGTLVSGTSTGNCTLTGSQAGQSTLQLGTSTVHMDVNNYDCGVFNVPTSTFPTSGVWKLTLTVTANGSSSSGSANVTI